MNIIERIPVFKIRVSLSHFLLQSIITQNEYRYTHLRSEIIFIFSAIRTAHALNINDVFHMRMRIAPLITD